MKGSFKNFLGKCKTQLSVHSPEIMIGVGIAGMLSSVIFAIKATPKAQEKIERAKEAKGDDLTKKEVVKTVWKEYIPAASTFALSAACIITSNRIESKRNAALTTACTLTETAFNEYRSKVIETIGEKKEQAMRDSIDKDRVTANPPKTNEVIFTGKGETLCYDTISGRYFKYDIDKLKRIELELNNRLLSEMYISLNEYYYAVGLPEVDCGNELGWNIERGLIKFNFSSQLTEDDTPCLVVSFDYSTSPKYDYKLPRM